MKRGLQFTNLRIDIIFLSHDINNVFIYAWLKVRMLP